MICFVVNNSYHMKKVNFFIKNSSYSKKDVVIVSISHNINSKDLEGFNFYEIDRFLNSRLDYFNIKKMFILKRKVMSFDFAFISKVYVFTEFEIVNCFFIKRAFLLKVPVYLVEDNGISSYQQFKIPEKELIFFNRYLLAKIVFNIISLRESNYNGYLHSRMPDRFFSGLIYAEKVTHCRNIETIYSKDFYDTDPFFEKKERFDNGEKVIFINQDLYNFYFDFNDYICFLKRSFSYIKDKSNCEKIYFRFHPRENSSQRERIVNAIGSDFSVVWLCNNDLYCDIERNGISRAYSFHSSSLLELKYKGIKVEFLCNSYDKELPKGLLIALNEMDELINL